MAKGKFITLEGGEGTGKSTQIKRLVDHLATIGIKAIATREPGGSPTAEEIREFWLGKEAGDWDIMTELLLVMAARREHLVRTVWPALEDGIWVISDRYVDSSRVYQGIAGGLGFDKVDEVYRTMAGSFDADLTLLLDLPVEVGLKRRALRQGREDRFEKQQQAFHEKLRQGYLELAKRDNKRIVVLNADQTIDAVEADIRNTVVKHFKLSLL